MAGRKIFHDSVVAIPIELGPAPNGLVVQPATAEHKAERLTLHFSLALPPDAERDLEAKVARGETVAADSLHTTYAAKQADADALTAWLKREGFTIEGVSPDNTSIYASATAVQIEKSLQVNMVRVNRNGFTYTAARNAPSLPSDIGDAVQAIGGLQPFRQAHKHGKRRQPAGGNRKRLENLEAGRSGPSPNIANAPPYLVGEVRKAYNADKLTVDGTGQTIAILIDTFPNDADLEAFWSRNGVPVTLAQIEKVNVLGGAVPPPEGEETLDV